MSREKPLTVRLQDLAVEQPLVDVFAMLVEKHRLMTRGKPYFKCQFRNLRRTVASVVWNDSPLFKDCEAAWTVGTIYKIRGHYTEHERYGPNLEVLAIRKTEPTDSADGFRESDFLERSRFDSDAMLAEILTITNGEIQDEALKRLTIRLFESHGEKLKLLPASPRAFYPFPGGWLEHVRNVVRNCLWLADQYAERFPELTPFNRDLVLAGALLHDIGRVAELEPGPPVETTVPGHLLGHVLLGRDLIRDAAREIPELNPELLLLLDHLIASHLVKPEWGSPRLPMIPEVLILHNADDLDAKFEMYARQLIQDAKDGPVTESDPVLRKPLLKGRTV